MAKRREVIDLTDDGDEPLSKRTKFRTPRQQKEKGNQKVDSAVTCHSIREDELLARELQAEYDLQSLGNAPMSSEHGACDEMQHENSFLHAHVQSIKQVSCSACRKVFVTGERDVLSIFKQWPANGSEPNQNAFQQFVSGGLLQGLIGEVTSVLTCPRKLCFANTCMGCGARGSAKIHKAEAAGVRELTWCCDQGRLFIIWALLCGYDRRQTNLALRKTSSSSKSKCKPKNFQDNGTGYGGDFGGKSRKKYHMKLQSDPEDGTTEKIMSCLTALLPCLTSQNPSTFDLEPPRVLCSILVNSKLLNKTAELLRNDSLEDATQRRSLYQVALQLVERLGSHPSTASATIHNERPELEQGKDLLQLSFSDEISMDGGAKAKETNQSLAGCLAGFDRQSKLMLERSKSDPGNFDAKDSKDMLLLCNLVSELSDFLLANSGRSPNTSNTHESSVCIEKDSWHEAIALLELPDHEILKTHYYANEAVRISKPPLGRMKALSLELARLSTGLPPGIFIRHCSSRLDVFKVLIIGPKGTPYENGLFEFDLLCGRNFPKDPPQMQFKTTGGGQIRFNPNLYADGKVCLSLLGTWSGEPWQPGSSTILQVLLSIQAMIFCDEPWCNEPGRELGAGSQSSIDYNRKVQEWTVQYAMANWLEQTGSNEKDGDDGIWSDVIMMHFQTGSNEILMKVAEWGIDQNVQNQLRNELSKVGLA